MGKWEVAVLVHVGRGVGSCREGGVHVGGRVGCGEDMGVAHVSGNIRQEGGKLRGWCTLEGGQGSETAGGVCCGGGSGWGSNLTGMQSTICFSAPKLLQSD